MGPRFMIKCLIQSMVLVSFFIYQLLLFTLPIALLCLAGGLVLWLGLSSVIPGLLLIAISLGLGATMLTARLTFSGNLPSPPR